MPLVVLCGQPSSGKTTVCRRLAERFLQRGLAVREIRIETDVALDKNEAYRGGIRAASAPTHTKQHGFR